MSRFIRKDGKWVPLTAEDVQRMGLGDLLEKLFKPVAKVMRMDCLNADGTLKPESECAKRKAMANQVKIPGL